MQNLKDLMVGDHAAGVTDIVYCIGMCQGVKEEVGYSAHLLRRNI